MTKSGNYLLLGCLQLSIPTDILRKLLRSDVRVQMSVMNIVWEDHMKEAIEKEGYHVMWKTYLLEI